MNDNRWCWFCGAKADLLCDGHLGWLKGMEGTRPVIDTRDPSKAQFTCDRPLCPACVAASTPYFACGPKGFIGSWDYCADCVKEDRNFPGGESRSMQRPTDLLTLEEGHAIQKRRLFQTTKPITDLDRALARIKELEAMLPETCNPDGRKPVPRGRVL